MLKINQMYFMTRPRPWLPSPARSRRSPWPPPCCTAPRCTPSPCCPSCSPQTESWLSDASSGTGRLRSGSGLGNEVDTQTHSIKRNVWRNFLLSHSDPAQMYTMFCCLSSVCHSLLIMKSLKTTTSVFKLKSSGGQIIPFQMQWSRSRKLH